MVRCRDRRGLALPTTSPDSPSLRSLSSLLHDAGPSMLPLRTVLARQTTLLMRRPAASDTVETLRGASFPVPVESSVRKSSGLNWPPSPRSQQLRSKASGWTRRDGRTRSSNEQRRPTPLGQRSRRRRPLVRPQQRPERTTTMERQDHQLEGILECVLIPRSLKGIWTD